MATRGDHIRCCATCQPAKDRELSELLLAKCGRCLFHRGCLPDNCKCGRPAHPAKKVGINGCIVPGCKECPSGWRMLCDGHLDKVVTKTVARIELMGSLHHKALVSFLAYYPGLSMEGDVLQIVADQVFRALHESWRIFCLDDGRYVYFTTFIAQLANGVPFHPAAMVEELDLPEAAVAELTRCGRSRVGNWVRQSDGLLKHATGNTKHTPRTATELYEFLKSPSRPTFPTAEAVAFYPAAPGDLARLIAAGKLIYLEHYKFVAAPPEVHTANPKLRDYWMEHIAAELRSSSADGMPYT